MKGAVHTRGSSGPPRGREVPTLEERAFASFVPPRGREAQRQPSRSPRDPARMTAVVTAIRDRAPVAPRGDKKPWPGYRREADKLKRDWEADVRRKAALSSLPVSESAPAWRDPVVAAQVPLKRWADQVRQERADKRWLAAWAARKRRLLGRRPQRRDIKPTKSSSSAERRPAQGQEEQGSLDRSSDTAASSPVPSPSSAIGAAEGEPRGRGAERYAPHRARHESNGS